MFIGSPKCPGQDLLLSPPNRARSRYITLSLFAHDRETSEDTYPSTKLTKLTIYNHNGGPLPVGTRETHKDRNKEDKESFFFCF